MSQDMKMKVKLEENFNFLDHSLSSNNGDGIGESSNKKELNLLAALEEYGEKMRREKERRIFHCKYCNKKFDKPQALGGHQNAHRKERSLAKTWGELFGPVNENPTRPIRSIGYQTDNEFIRGSGITVNPMIPEPHYGCFEGFGCDYPNIWSPMLGGTSIVSNMNNAKSSLGGKLACDLQGNDLSFKL